jgi:hypothetical protein
VGIDFYAPEPARADETPHQVAETAGSAALNGRARRIPGSRCAVAAVARSDVAVALTLVRQLALAQVADVVPWLRADRRRVAAASLGAEWPWWRGG